MPRKPGPALGAEFAVIPLRFNQSADRPKGIGEKCPKCRSLHDPPPATHVERRRLVRPLLAEYPQFVPIIISPMRRKRP
jgi:hypothetical protein